MTKVTDNLIMTAPLPTLFLPDWVIAPGFPSKESHRTHFICLSHVAFNSPVNIKKRSKWMICRFRRHRLKVFIPSTIGAFGPSTPRDSTPDCTVQEPTTIYGVSKIYAERLGEYYHSKFGVDFRCLRFPGIISATKPGGGTTGQSTVKSVILQNNPSHPSLSDYAIKIFYDALQYGKHVCYLRPDTKLPMMYDTDCMSSVVQVCAPFLHLANDTSQFTYLQFLTAPQNLLHRRTYNVTGFSFTPDEIATSIQKILPNFKIEYNICPIRQAIGEWLDCFLFNSSWPDCSWFVAALSGRLRCCSRLGLEGWIRTRGDCAGEYMEMDWNERSEWVNCRWCWPWSNEIWLS